MTKLSANDADGLPDDVLYRGTAFCIRAMRLANGRMPAGKWLEDLEPRFRDRFEAACQSADAQLVARGTSPRLCRFEGDFYALRVTSKGGTGPHLRLTLHREGTTFWAGLGFTKDKGDLNKSEKEKALNLIDKWKADRPDDQL